MPREHFLFTSESVSEGHPDKVCDRISDCVVDAHLAKFPEARVACETLATTNRVLIAGEVRGSPEVDAAVVEQCAREAIRDIGYHQEGFHWQNCQVDVLLHEQSPDIAQGVDAGEAKEEGAGDQGIMFGFACRETPELMPAPILYAHKILHLMAGARHAGRAPELMPDSKSQVTVRYENGVPVGVHSIVVSTQHAKGLTSADVRKIVEPFVYEALPEGWINDETTWHVNPTGKFEVGGPDGDCGLTGRKIIVDTYGGAAPHGGGAFSGKDPTKVDRSAAYAARYLAKNIVAADLAERCTIQVSYAIGVAKPLSIYVDTHGTAKNVRSSDIERAINKVMDLSPRGIRQHLQLNRPIYARTAAYGHFGRAPEADGGFSWEKTDLADSIRDAL
ncbi:methionine adenosyltransferase [Afifella marina]|uniref:S-adenosylmethionine synthase n=1 Tax=Afifella marina DSM 2698 TaxID=1120955 RepID=A0A1G5NEJ5_AFIMA|nr:methionine adenosyltransferase [Afifella marina]MBK1623303.1 methionine adenosyltransferase [Afifella marina DSM 2698]MBK1626297.1 methionine adenosyltransferase [Afifella marina]MBK5917175.1 methionine adenosyltransferase [Afifella marina]RAI22231.1 methionine adenosyltransferase [Afifella marina DSM 2698]SCZ35149.1 methionine adenosyltransferase [Afifella marina DSM 2698]